MTPTATAPSDAAASSAAPRTRKEARAARRKVKSIDAIASAPRRRRRRLIALAVVLVLLAGAIIWAAWFSTLLTVKSVRVVGVDGTLSQEVLSTAAIPVGVPLARLDTDAAVTRVLALDWVSQAEVRRGWPQEAVVAVEARVPLAALASSSVSAVDGEGTAFDVGDTSVLKDLPKVDAPVDVLPEIMAVLTELPPDLAKRVTKASAKTRDSIELSLRSGKELRWGSAERMAEKIAVARVLLERRGTFYDVSSPSAPTIFRG